MSILTERSKQDFLVYANSVIKSRAIPSVEDNLKPIHRKILWTLYEDKLFPNKKTSKCASVVGDALHYSPHGDASVYGALVRLAQWWKLRYPLVYIQGNAGNILGDSAAASRYTECRLSPVGALMLDDIDKNCVDMKPNYSGEQEEPVTLPSRFPFLLCGNNSGIAVGMSSDLVSHNFTEVAEGIKYYIGHQDCSIADLLQFIKGPDFPTGGKILNGEELLDIYTKGHGAVKVAAHYDVIKCGGKTKLVFHDLPYGVEIDSGVKTPLKKLVLDDGYEVFEDIVTEKVGPHNFDITITLARNADPAKCLEILFNKTRLCDSVKINQTVIVDGEPQLMNLKQLIAYWVRYRSNIIKCIAQSDYDKTNHKLTVTLGLQKCMSDIDKLIQLIRSADNRTAAKSAIMHEFSLNDEQAEAVLDIKLSKLSRLDLTELNDTEKELEKTLAALSVTINDENTRFKMISDDLDAIKKIIGEDARLTEITYARHVGSITPQPKEAHKIYANGTHLELGNNSVDPDLVDIVITSTFNNIVGYCTNGTMSPINETTTSFIGALSPAGQTKLVSVTKNGNIKISLASDYKFTKVDEKIMKIKEDDALVFAALCDDADSILILGDEDRILRLAIKDLVVASKATTGVKSGITHVLSAVVAKPNDQLLLATKDGKGKLTPVSGFSMDNRGNKGQNVADGTVFIRNAASRNSFYLVTNKNKVITLPASKLATKGRMAIGASLSAYPLARVV